ncbi:unnamed protein product [Symbiodinium natans]|uniref:Uncharacterized protein n=1 Tax=Symbiodinium natans TaxID=878477 RepID=A0A812T8X3_9DINO|nr:unnamed protein product [Symbiodinium natans]
MVGNRSRNSCARPTAEPGQGGAAAYGGASFATAPTVSASLSGCWATGAGMARASSGPDVCSSPSTCSSRFSETCGASTAERGAGGASARRNSSEKRSSALANAEPPYERAWFLGPITL